MTKTFIDGFKIIKDGKVIDEFLYFRRGNIYEITNNNGNLFSDDSYTRAQEFWNKTIKENKLRKMMGFEISEL